ncbi:hypothetical protein [Nocardioides pacificus]
MSLAERSHLLGWLAPVVGVVVVALIYRGTYESERGLYAGAEPALAGALVAAPFVVLALLQVGCALVITSSRSPRSRAAGAGIAAVATGIAVVGAYVVLTD